MGFEHINDRKSILNSSCSPDLTEEDIKMIDSYNVQFYGTKSIFEEEIENNEYNEYTTDMSY